MGHGKIKAELFIKDRGYKHKFINISFYESLSEQNVLKKFENLI